VANGGRFSALPSRNSTADPGGFESSTEQMGTLLTRSGDSPDSISLIKEGCNSMNSIG
jgi:hypothetical protein